MRRFLQNLIGHLGLMGAGIAILFAFAFGDACEGSCRRGALLGAQLGVALAGAALALGVYLAALRDRPRAFAALLLAGLACYAGWGLMLLLGTT